MDTRTALLRHAEIVVRARGYDGFSYADLADAVGIRKASVHHHFPTKADLALALINGYSTSFFATLDEITAAHRTGGERLRAYVAASRNALDGAERLCLCVALSAGRDALSALALEKLDQFNVTVASWLAGVFTIGADDGSIASVRNASVEAEACLAQMQGAQLIARAAKDVARFDAAVGRLLERIN